MSQNEEKDQEKNEGLPGTSKGAGGAGRVAGLLETEKAQDAQGTLRRLLANIGPFKGLFIAALALTILASLAQVLTPRLVGQIINLITESIGQANTLNWQEFLNRIIILALLYVANFAASYLSSVFMVRMTQKVIRSLRNQMQEKLNKLTLDYFDQSSTGDLLSLLTNDLDNVANTLQTGLTSSLTAIIMFIGVTIMMFTIHPWLALMSLVVIPISYGLVNFLIKKARPIFKRNANLTGAFNGRIEEAYNGVDVVNHYDLGDDLKAELAELNEDLYDSEWKSSYVSFMTRPAGDLVLNGNYVLISILGGYYVIMGQLTLGEFQAFIQYAQMLRSPFQQVLGILNTLMSALASMERIYLFLDAEEIQQIGTEDLNLEEVSGSIDFSRVDFGYTDDLLFKDVSLTVKPGQQLAIVGTTGAGKTTLVNLLMRFYEINDGVIQLDGVDTQSYHTNELRKAFSMVLQDTWLFSGTIRENIAYGAQLEEGQSLADVPLEDVQAAARLARADSFIERLPDGYDTQLKEGGSNISQGEAQLLTIARAIIKQAPIIILDEATSSVDTRTELLIQQGMAELTAQSTSFIIAHRLSTIHDADRIIVMDQGDIIETGSHEELLEKNGHYAEMYLAGQN